MWYTFWMTNRWLLVNFDTLGGFAVLLTTLFCLSGFVSAGIAGLCVRIALFVVSIPDITIDHLCNVVYYVILLGMSILDSFGARFEVRFLSSFRSLIFMSNTKQFS